MLAEQFVGILVQGNALFLNQPYLHCNKNVGRYLYPWFRADLLHDIVQITQRLGENE